MFLSIRRSLAELRSVYHIAIAALCLIAGTSAARADGAPTPYATWVQGATAQRGLFTIWHKDGKPYIELTADQLNRDYVQTIVPGTGLGGWFVVWGNTDHLPTELVRFERAGDQIAILWPNPNFVAPKDASAQLSVEESFPRSIVGLASIVAEDATSGTVVMDASPFLGDMIDLKDILLQNLPLSGSDQAYRLDADKSYIGVTKSFPDNIVIEAEQDWTTDNASVVDTAPDNRNLQFRVVYNIAQPPGHADYRPRYADDRVGLYNDIYLDFSNDNVRERQLRYLIRWDLQPSDPSKKLSPATHPMVFYLSNTIPVAYRPAIRKALMTWNDAFIPLGISDALQVRDQPNDPNWDADDIRYNVIRWVSEARPSFGADSQTLYDPRTGEEFRTGILVSAGSSFNEHLTWKWIVDPVRYGRTTDPMPASFLNDSIVSEILHETGHNLGMQHNFIGSMAYTAKELQDPSFTAKYGITSTVMEYAPMNLWPRPDGQGAFSQTVLGPYDYYAMKYAYGRIPGTSTPEAERPTLAKWASAWSDPRYRYASDEDVSWGDGHAADPRVEQGDLTNDPLGWCQTQISMFHTLVTSLNSRLPESGEAYEEETAAFQRMLGSVVRCDVLPERFIGGQYLSRAHRGDPGAQTPIDPVPYATQQRAFSMLSNDLFSDAQWKLSPSLLDKLGYSEWAGYGYVEFQGYGNLPLWAYDPPARHYESLSSVVGNAQQGVLDFLFSPSVLQRLADNPGMAANGKTMSLSDLFSWMQSSVYSEVGRRSDVSDLRRALQLRYEATLAGLVDSPQPHTPLDASSLARSELSALDSGCAAALRSQGLDMISRAHYETLRAKAEQALNPR